MCGCSACFTLRTTLPSTRRQSPFDKSQLRYLCISLITRRSLYRFRTIRTAKAAVLAMKSAAYVQFLSNLCICERSTVYLHPSESRVHRRPRPHTQREFTPVQFARSRGQRGNECEGAASYGTAGGPSWTRSPVARGEPGDFTGNHTVTRRGS